jgi:hypothetical protein
MGQRKVSERTAQSVYSSVTHHLSATRRLHPQDFPLDFEIPPHGLRKTRSGRRADCLSEDIFGEIIHAAELQANVIQDRYGPGDFPKRGTDLIPFMILIAANTAMNAFSLYGLRRTCLQDHPIDEHGVYLIWKKARSSKGIQKQLHWRRLSPTIKLIRFVIDYTEPLVEWAPAPLQEFLFLYQYTHHKSHRSRVVSMKHFQNHLKSLGSFREKNALPHFTFGQIRPSVATHNHLKNGGNLRKTQMLLGHKDIETTETYINKRIVEPLYNKSIRSAQEAMVNTITVIPKRAEEAVAELTPGLTPAQSKRIIRGEFSTGLCRCRNPLNSPQPGQRKGHMCTLFLACLTCPNALFFQEDLPRVIAFANHLNSLKKTMSKQTWDELYSKQLRILDEEIIGAFSEKDIADAKLKSSAITDMSLLMNDNLSA